jgi:Mrp family chromosome partitioning ATPase
MVKAGESEKSKISQMGEVDSFSPNELERLKIIDGRNSNKKLLNTFRGLRTQLLKFNNKKNFVCMVSSITHEGGASFVAKNLAAVFALDKLKTSLIIDANLYSPSLHELVIGDTGSGVTDYLSSSSLDVKDIVYATGVPRLRVVPIGENSEGAAEYFSSEKMHKFIDEMKSRYSDRYIFIDAPPVSDSSEARILTEVADMVVLVVPHGRATPDQIEKSIQAVDTEKLAGLVYND